jgi:hypothetical protein
MRVRLVEIEVEGSLDEITRYFAGKLPQPGITQPLVPAKVALPSVPIPSGPLTVDVAKAALTHCHLPTSHLKMLRIIYAAHPKKVPISDLCKKLGLTEKQMKGVMGSFGRRLNQIPGYDNGMTFITQDNAGYGLADAARTALENLRLV